MDNATPPTPAALCDCYGDLSPRGCSVEELRSTLTELKTLTYDISESLNNELNYNQKLFHTLTNSLDEGIIITDNLGQIRIANLSSSIMLGGGGTELKGSNIAKWLPQIENYVSKDRRKWHEHAFSPGDIGAGNASLEIVATRIDAVITNALHEGVGDNCVILLRYPAIGQATAGNFSNISSFKAALLDKIPTYYLYSDPHGGNVRGSPEFYSFLGRSAEDQDELHVESIFNSKLVQRFTDQDPHIDPNRMEVFETSVEVAPLDVRDVVVYKSVFTATDNITVLGHTAIILDISERHKLDVHDGARLIVETLNHSDMPMVITKWPVCRVLRINAAFTAEFGTLARDILGTRISKLLGRSISATVLDSITTSINSGHTWEGPLLLARDYRTPEEYRVIITPIVREGDSGPSYCVFAAFNLYL